MSNYRKRNRRSEHMGIAMNYRKNFRRSIDGIDFTSSLNVTLIEFLVIL